MGVVHGAQRTWSGQRTSDQAVTCESFGQQPLDRKDAGTDGQVPYVERKRVRAFVLVGLSWTLTDVAGTKL